MATIRYTAGGDYDWANSDDVSSVGGTSIADRVIANQSQAIGIAGDPQIALGAAGRMYLAVSPNNYFSFRDLADNYIEYTQAGFLLDASDATGSMTFSGGSYGDVVITGSSNDVIYGKGGNDVLEGGAGSDTIDGGDGIDTISFEHSTVGVQIILRGQTDGYGADGDANGDSWIGIENARGGAGDDRIAGDTDIGRNVLEGGGGADVISADASDIVTYEHSVAGVTVNLTTGINSSGDADRDTLLGVANVMGSAHADTLIGDAFGNILRGGGGADTLDGGLGNDRLVITATPADIDGGGGNGKDFLFVKGGGTIALTDANFANIDTVYVQIDTTLDMTRVTMGSIIKSQSTAGHHVTMTGTAGGDRIVAGKGGDVLDGGTGFDNLFGGEGADSFHFSAGLGRDVISRFDADLDTLDLSAVANDLADVIIKAVHGGASTQITLVGETDPTQKIILADVLASTFDGGAHLSF